MTCLNQILWLEDEPESIEVLKHELKVYCENIIVRESFAGFSDFLEDFEDLSNNVIIIDIRMMFSREMSFSCFEKEDIKIYNEHDSGFEYFNACIKNKFSKVTVIFFSSKPKEETLKDAKRYKVDMHLIVSKDCTTDLISFVKDIK